MNTHYDYLTWLQAKFLGRAGQLGSILMMSALLLMGVGRSENTKFWLYGVATVAMGTAEAARRAAENATEVVQDVKTTASVRRQRDMLGYKEPVTDPEKIPAVEAYNLDQLQDRDAVPALIISGKQGAGKTTVAQYIGATQQVEGVKRYAISPHMKPDDFVGFDGRIGWIKDLEDSNYWSENDQAVSWTDITFGRVLSPSIWQTFNALLHEFKVRSLHLANGGSRKELEPLDIYLDETLAINQFFQSYGPKDLKDFPRQFFLKALTEFRKTNMRVFMLSQATTVEALGLGGFSQLKDDTVFIRLGPAAKKFAQELKNKKLIEEDVFRYIIRKDRPAMVDEMPLDLPTYDQMMRAIQANIRTDRKTPKTQGKQFSNEDLQAIKEQLERSMVTSGSAKSAEVSEGMKTPEKPIISDTHPAPDTVSDKVSHDRTNPADSTFQRFRVGGKRFQQYQTLAELDEATRGLIGTKRTDGKNWTKSNIIKEFWGITSGDQYKKAVQMWNDMGL